MNGVPRIPSPREWVLTRPCTNCEQTKPWAHFSPKTYWSDGSIKTVASWCHECESEKQRERQHGSQVERNQYKRRWDQRHRRGNPAGRRLQIDPIRSFIRRHQSVGMGMGEIADACGIPERSIHRLLYEHEHVSLRLADTIVTRLGSHLYDVYPELSEVAA